MSEKEPEMIKKCEIIVKNAKIDGFHSFFPQTNYRTLFYTISLNYLSLKVYQKSKDRSQKVEIDGNYPIRQSETPKEKRLGFGSHFGHIHPW
jgi:hypothetical protein